MVLEATTKQLEDPVPLFLISVLATSRLYRAKSTEARMFGREHF